MSTYNKMVAADSQGDKRRSKRLNRKWSREKDKLFARGEFAREKFGKKEVD